MKTAAVKTLIFFKKVLIEFRMMKNFILLFIKKNKEINAKQSLRFLESKILKKSKV